MVDETKVIPHVEAWQQLLLTRNYIVSQLCKLSWDISSYDDPGDHGRCQTDVISLEQFIGNEVRDVASGLRLEVEVLIGEIRAKLFAEPVLHKEAQC